MKIKEITFKNNANRWELEKTAFSDLTLLVGASGVGKTQILNSILKLINISIGYAYNGVQWDISFTSNNNEDYRWTGQFENIEAPGAQEFNEKEISGNEKPGEIPRLMNEKLFMGKTLVFERKTNTVNYEQKDVPKISPHKSVLSLFTEEDKIVPVKDAFRNIVFHDYHKEKNMVITTVTIHGVSNTFEQVRAEIAVPEFLNELKIPIVLKLALAFQMYKSKFDEIIDDFKDIFPRVEDVRFQLIQKRDIYELQIKERGTGWISRNEISDGMFKSLLHIAELKLIPDGSVILIDEFENSLGTNCIDTIAANILKPGRDIQYILTSHHPYIINNIGMQHWKVVVRNGTKVSTRSADQLKLGKSRHEAFKQLLNLDEFTEGIY